MGHICTYIYSWPSPVAGSQSHGLCDGVGRGLLRDKCRQSLLLRLRPSRLWLAHQPTPKGVESRVLRRVTVCLTRGMTLLDNMLCCSECVGYGVDLSFVLCTHDDKLPWPTVVIRPERKRHSVSLRIIGLQLPQRNIQFSYYYQRATSLKKLCVISCYQIETPTYKRFGLL